MVHLDQGGVVQESDSSRKSVKGKKLRWFVDFSDSFSYRRLVCALQGGHDVLPLGAAGERAAAGARDVQAHDGALLRAPRAGPAHVSLSGFFSPSEFAESIFVFFF